MKKIIREKISIQLAKNPGRMVLLGILFFNIVFFTIAALIISAMPVSGTEQMSFLEAAYYTITMILDAGCISSVIEDIGTSGVVIAITCLVIIVIGMITFTGAVIGYVTNWISKFIENANTGTRRLRISNHTVVLNWNTRASEIINDLLYSEHKEKVVILVNSRKEEIKKEIDERLSETTAKENAAIHEYAAKLSFFKRRQYIRKHKIRRSVTFIVRQGDVFSLKQLKDIQVEQAKAIVILGNDVNNSICKFDTEAHREDKSRGNSQTIKTLMQVADITASDFSVDNQKIIVEITDPWTQDIVEKIIRSKQIDQKCNIVPVFVNQILGQILSQFSLMPELNLIYRELFSNKGAAFYTQQVDVDDDEAYIEDYIQKHSHAIPLVSLKEKDKSYFFYVCDSEQSISKVSGATKSNYSVKLNYDYWIEKKNVIILGHNGDCDEIMDGFSAFRCEWNYDNEEDGEILRVTVIDDKEHLEKMNYYRQYPFVVETVVANIYDKDIICETINKVLSHTDGDTSVLILSDDSSLTENIDANALANLIYVQDIIKDKRLDDSKFDENSIDVVVEIIDPKHHDIVNSYNVNNVVISNRYISKMITQIGEKEAIYNFYSDILTYDLDADEDGGYESKEVYAKKVSTFFKELPAPCKADELIRAVYHASVHPDPGSNYTSNPTLVLGYVRKSGEMVIFSGDLSAIDVELKSSDKIIVYTTH